ncbi:MAG: hypothetical protein KBS81_09815, partial [Spirochaetales bacterium]|nr:hypothetical protein [Candidatus Physcosoma equi]
YTIEAQGAFQKNAAKISKRLLENTMLFAEDWSNNLQLSINALNSLRLNEYYCDPVDLLFGGDVVIHFYALEEPVEESLVLYRPLTYKANTSFSPIPGTLEKKEEEGSYSVAFDFMDIYFTTPYSGSFEYVLEGKDKKGNKYGGQVILNASEF